MTPGFAAPLRAQPDVLMGSWLADGPGAPDRQDQAGVGDQAFRAETDAEKRHNAFT